MERLQRDPYNLQQSHDDFEMQQVQKDSHRLLIRAESPAFEQKTPGLDDKPPLRYFKTSIVLVCIYLPFLITPWVMTAILNVRPLNRPSWNDQSGGIPGDFASTTETWNRAIRVLNSIGNILTVPVTSALLAHGAVVYTQRTSHTQRTSLRQTLSMADRIWSDVPAMWHALSNGAGSSYVWLASLVVLLASIQAGVQQLFVSSESISIMTYSDLPFDRTDSGLDGWNGDKASFPIADDPEPFALGVMPHEIVIRETINSMANFDDYRVTPHLWHDPSMSDDDLSDLVSSRSNVLGQYVTRFSNQPGNFFVAGLLNATTTGILREHIMRVNSSITCGNAVFPTCSGPNPFTASFFNTIRVCAPGNYTASPWTLSRSRQDIQEEFYLDYQYTTASSIIDDGRAEIPARNFTIHCTATSTRGYFELGNYHNNYFPGPLLQTWPDNQTLSTSFNDYLSVQDHYAIPQDIDLYYGNQDTDYTFPLGSDDAMTPTPGPLMTSILALFGPTSFMADLGNATNFDVLRTICTSNKVPFQQIRSSALFWEGIRGECYRLADYGRQTGEASDLASVIGNNWIEPFGNINQTTDYIFNAQDLLMVSMFLSAEAWLVTTAGATSEILSNARTIFSSPGIVITKPKISTGGTIVVSVIIALQVVSLVVLLGYIYRRPTWTSRFDSVAVARLTESIPLPPIRPVGEEDLNKFNEIDGLVGVDMHAGRQSLSRGGPGIVRRRAVVR